MKVCHWTQFTHSGMNRVAETMAEAERRLGLDSAICNVFEEKDWDRTLDADVHVAHTHFPELYNGKSMRRQLQKPFKLVWIGHGTPEFVFESTVQEGKGMRHGVGDGLMIQQYWLQNADARVTFWPRHQWIYQSMVDKGTIVDCIPLGIDLEFWKGGESKGKWAGSPSVWTGENPHPIKWPIDLIHAWPYVYRELDGASLHACYLVTDLHRQFAPIINRNGAGYGMHWSPQLFTHETLRNVFKSIDFFIGLVRYGDFNRLCLEANAAGVAKTISYPGNPYSDFHVPEGDQREVARVLVDILKGNVEPRAKTPVPDASEMATAMQAIYERILS